jgi:uncharacterized protein YlxW (UPF0749 family)
VRRSLASQVCLAVLLLGMSTAMVGQFRVQRHLRGLTYSPDEQAILLSELADANYRLRNEIRSLTAQEAAYAESRGPVLEELVAELNHVRMLNGMIEASGPGIELLIDGPLNALDLSDLVNELRNAGAEAIALNGRRLVINSVFAVEDRGLIMADGVIVRRPYRLSAIGDADTMETALLRSGGLVGILQRTYPNLMVQTTHHSRLVLDVHRPQLTLEYAQPIN